ncbi:lipoprotein insertase outer membrane protein LolB [Aestuariibacter salexigens]|uniref:lipoprotein insertase outer membrane protein LolB n=1 Tax=Aestuariibacter salexigens TaxID=226010 RepID=UPI000686DD2C|nr:lipoprotein insertase outer membrane protein LolB [Aestuariibacter salexigens]
MSRLFHFAVLTVLLLMSVACTTTHQLPDDLDQQQHQRALQQFDAWQVRGRFAFNSAEEKFSASMSWQHQPGTYQFKLFSLLGSELVSLEQVDGQVQLTLDEQTHTDTNASFLIWRMTGWNIPVSRLPYWLKGMAMPGDSAEFDEKGLIRTLTPTCQRCARWKLDYDRYEEYEGLWLPHRISLTNLDDTTNRIRIRIDSWRRV